MASAKKSAEAEEPNLKKLQQKINNQILRGLRVILDSDALENRIRDLIEKVKTDTMGQEDLVFFVNTRVAEEVTRKLESDSFDSSVKAIARQVTRDLLATEGAGTGQAEEATAPKLKEFEQRLATVEASSPSEDNVVNLVKTLLGNADFNTTLKAFIEESLANLREELTLRISSATRLIEEKEAALRDEILRGMTDSAKEVDEKLKAFGEGVGGMPNGQVDDVISKVLESLAITFAKIESALRQKIEKAIKEVHEQVEKGEADFTELKNSFTEELQKTSTELLEKMSDAQEKFFASPGAAAQIENILMKDILRDQPIPQTEDIERVVDRRIEERTRQDAEDVAERTLEALELSPQFVDKIESVVEERLANVSAQLLDSIQRNTLIALDPAIGEKLTSTLPGAAKKAVKEAMRGVKNELQAELSQVMEFFVRDKFRDTTKEVAEEVSSQADKTIEALLKDHVRRARKDIGMLLREELKETLGDIATSSLEKAEPNMRKILLESLDEKLEKSHEKIIKKLSGKPMKTMRFDLEKILDEKSDEREKDSRDIVKVALKHMQGRITKDLTKIIDERLDEVVSKRIDKKLEEVGPLLEKRAQDKLSDKLSESLTAQLTVASQMTKEDIHKKVLESVDELIMAKAGHIYKEQFDQLGGLLEKSFKDKLLPEADKMVSSRVKNEFAALGNLVTQHIEQDLMVRVDEIVGKRMEKQMGTIGKLFASQIKNFAGDLVDQRFSELEAELKRQAEEEK